ncbi:hypothetical protein phytr_7300 [Candidatus Phycorickettsia trachydisci]|uniref:Glyceraldehyde 3-phosphate dehydrogenase NAD(P) binding domain-containing protein n=1 Tax=Candidatus Phycorickettsia trachydisci TaxID=2115978 RepID=A0A2P1P8R6_9RICK|nr:type I glyceraldehyde-3-phosphate dehydrogenase [Candidatus Phycorickettsia trachydisci]AVP87668.1 hypothetical protein phytr_7300 [Candidatus Phycorickettsia trachydisci]
MKVGINGLGRIGRLLLRKLLEEKIEVTQINTSAKPSDLAHLIEYDSTHGKAPFEIEIDEDKLIINKHKIKVSSYKDITQIPWEVDLVFECSGKCKNKESAAKHKANKIVVSSPCEGADSTIVLGANDQELKKNHKVISIGSCTTNALAPVVKILHEKFGILSGYATTVHSYTFDQNLLDNFHDDIRRARSASCNMIPTKSGISQALKIVLPKIGHKISGSAIRVPVPNVSLVDFSFYSARPTSKDEVNNVMEKASWKIPKILSIAKKPLVSGDFNHTTFSSIFDPFETSVVEKSFVRVLAWYDNEWGFVNRLFDIYEKIRTSR